LQHNWKQVYIWNCRMKWWEQFNGEYCPKTLKRTVLVSWSMLKLIFFITSTLFGLVSYIFYISSVDVSVSEFVLHRLKQGIYVSKKYIFHVLNGRVWRASSSRILTTITSHFSIRWRRSDVTQHPAPPIAGYFSIMGQSHLCNPRF
jgi:hypothetical protein